MRRLAFVLLALLLGAVARGGEARQPSFEREDDDFAEFDFDADEEWEQGVDEEEEEIEDVDEEDMSVEEEGEGEGGDFEAVDEDEFEHGHSAAPLDKIELSESAVRVQPVWLAYLGEILIALSLLLYLVNYISGRSKNANIAQAWLDRHISLLRSNFALVGEVKEEGEEQEEQEGEGEEEGRETEGEGDGKLIKESDDTYSVWASGRVNCEGFQAQIRMLRRQDLLSILLSFIWPQQDSVTIVVQLGEGDMDSIILAVGQKKALTKMQQEYEDLNRYCSQPRPAKRLGLDSDLQLVCEAPEVAQVVLNQQIVVFLNRHAHLLDSLHISNAYTGFMPDAEDTSEVTVVRKTQNRLQMTFKLGGDGDEVVRFALGLVDHLKVTRLSKEAREKAQKNRNRVAQDKEKLQHQQRQEAAQTRREEKKRLEKEKMLLEEDPEKTRKWEQREHKKQMRKLLNPKMKSVKMKMK